MPETSPPPASIGKYRIEREIGRGASGVVYLGLDGFRGRRVAIKQMHAHLLADPAQAQRYRRLLRNEAALAGRLRHPHIVRLLLGPAHRTLLPAAALFGGAFLVLADALARTMVTPAELPIGIITAILGAPVFLMLLLGRQGRQAMEGL